MTTVQRFISVRLLLLLSSMAAKRSELERVGIQLDLMTELQEKVSRALFEVNGIDPVQANILWLSLEDYITGRIKEYELLSLLAGFKGEQFIKI